MRSTRTRWWQRTAVAISALAVGAATVIAAAPAVSAEPSRSTDVEVTSATSAGLTIHVEGSGYTDLPVASTGSAAQGVYVALRDVTTTDEQINADTSVVPAVSFVYGRTAITDGAWSTDLEAPTSKLSAGADYEVIVWVAHGNITEATLLDTVPVTLSEDQKNALFPDGEAGDGGGSGDPGAPPTDAPRNTTVSVTSATASGGLRLSVSGTGYTDLPKASTGANAAGIYAAVVASSTTESWIAAHVSDLGAFSAVTYIPSISGGAWSWAPTVPTSKLVKDESYDVIVWVAHGNPTSETTLYRGAIGISSTQMAALFPSGGAQSTDADSVSITGAGNTGPVTHGKQLTFTASGFTPGEQVTATVHSDPVVIGTKAADADGRVTFSWTVPAGFAAGVHRIVLNAPSGAREAVFTVVAAAAATPSTTTRASASTTVLPSATVQCTTETVPATAATSRLTWGVDSSFVSYVEGSIAKGTISVAGGAARVGQQFTWGTGAGSLNGSGAGTLRFPGSVHFTGHDGVLNLTVSNVRVAVTGPKSGTLIADIASTDMSGKDVSGKGVVLATLAFSSLSGGGGKATATLTGAGAAAFAGFYEAGRTLAPVTIVVVAGTPASTVERCVNAAGDPVNGDGTAVRGLASTGVDVPGLAGVAALLTLLGAALIAAARRRQVTAAHR